MQAPTRFKVAAVHASPVFMNKQASIDKAIGFIEEAGRSGISLLVFPEAFVPGYPYWGSCFPTMNQIPVNVMFARASVEIPGPEIARVQAACKRAGAAVVLGVSERLKNTGTCFNSQVYIDSDGRLLGVHRKLVPTYVERIVWAQGGGATLKVFDMNVGRVGGLACWEHTMNLARQSLIEQGQQIHAASWPGLSCFRGNDYDDQFDIQIDAMMKSHALTGQVFVICAANPVDAGCLDWIEQHLGSQDTVGLGGGWSSVIHPFNRYLAAPHTGAQEQLVVAEIDLSDLDTVKAWVDARGHYSRPEVVRMKTDHRPIWHDEPIVSIEPDMGDASH